MSPFAKSNFVDHTVSDQSSFLRFVEDNWSLGSIGDSSFDAKAGSLANLFDISRQQSQKVAPASGEPRG